MVAVPRLPNVGALNRGPPPTHNTQRRRQPWESTTKAYPVFLLSKICHKDQFFQSHFHRRQNHTFAAATMFVTLSATDFTPQTRPHHTKPYSSPQLKNGIHESAHSNLSPVHILPAGMPPRISKVEKDDPTSEFATDITIDPNALVHAPVYPKDPGRITPVSEETRYIAIIEQKLILVSFPHTPTYSVLTITGPRLHPQRNFAQSRPRPKYAERQDGDAAS